MSTATTLGRAFAAALAAKDFDRLIDLLDPEIDFRGMTPSRFWEAGDPESVVSGVLRLWFEDTDDIVSVDRVETDMVADRERVGYRFTVVNPDGRFVVEQQAYLSERDDRISWMRVLCSGFRRVDDAR
jgi:hypothetical protein